MTSMMTTGGIRGKKKGVGEFQPRSFNMGLSKKAFQATKGFNEQRYGEDIELVLASPRAPEDQPNYLAKIFDNGKLSFGYMRDDNKIVRMVAEIKIKN